MLCSVVICNYNYENFLRDCLGSVSEQSYENIEIIVVDDGSTDDSRKILAEFEKDRKFKILLKDNGGQLSCFNYALDFVSGDIVCFLDADDMYEKNYLEEVVQIFSSNPDCDFLFVNKKYIDEFGKIIKSNTIKSNCPILENLGFSLLKSFYLKRWIGASTSCISMRKKILDKILPLPFEEDWRVRADDVLVWGASLVGAKKYRYNKPLVKYRIHSSNYFYGKKYDTSYCYKRQININKMFKYLLEKNNIDPDVRSLLVFEYMSIKDKKLSDLVDYLKILVLSNLPAILKTKYLVSLVKTYFKTKQEMEC